MNPSGLPSTPFAGPPSDRDRPSPAGRNGFAIGSLVAALAAPCGGALFSVTFGIIALLQIRKTGQRGKGLAVAGLVLTAAWIVGIATVVATGVLNDDPVRNEAGEITRSERVSAFALATGDCVNDVHMHNVSVVPCAEPHRGQVYAVVALALTDDWPGAEVIAAEVDRSCVDELADFSQAAFDDETVEIYYFYPNRATWLAGGREATCVAYFADGQRTGSLAD